MSGSSAATRVVRPCRRLAGRARMPGDKSISHRALMLGALARGKTVVRGFQEGADCLATWRALAQMGVQISRDSAGAVAVIGRGLDGLQEPSDVVNCANSGTTMRILSGMLAGTRRFFVLTGDDSLRRRPMERVVRPLVRMGAEIWAREGLYAPLAIRGRSLEAVEYCTPVASAQVKSALTLAALLADGTTRIEEPSRSRDHTERMLVYMGVQLEVGGRTVAVKGRQQPEAREIDVPGDLSAAAFLLAAAAIRPGSVVRLEDVGVNPTRSTFLRVLMRMGVQITIENERQVSGEPRADITVEGPGRLQATTLGAEAIPGMIDEVPLVAVLGCFAQGTTRISGAEELRVKETDRLHALAVELSKMGAGLTEYPGGLAIEGRQGLQGTVVKSWGDHRIAMALSVAALGAQGSTHVEETGCVAVSFPGFYSLLEEIAVR